MKDAVVEVDVEAEVEDGTSEVRWNEGREWER